MSNRHNFTSTNARKHWERSIQTLKTYLPADIAERVVEFEEVVPAGSKVFLADLDFLVEGGELDDAVRHRHLPIYGKLGTEDKEMDEFGYQFARACKEEFRRPVKGTVYFALKPKERD